ncbi:MAG: hypothetical protein KTR26_14125 [Flammeovirgaceae bacterium]|nr:hypothetical protein [Flammeovirgaceae bacterium]
MKDSFCPLCYSALEVKEVTPCMECGGDDFEQDHYKEHKYAEYELYFGQRLILCNFCDVDFGSFDPTYFGFPPGTKVGIGDFHFIREISDKELRKDKYCPECGYRLSFLKFVETCKRENEK